MFKLAHISDIHLTPMPAVRKRDLLSKRLTGHINWVRNRSRGHRPEVLELLVDHMKARHPDHVAVTGDLVNLALPEEIRNATTWLERLGEPHDTTVVCGNHDAYVPGALKQAFESWQAYLQGDQHNTVSGSGDYPILRLRNEIALIGCNSARATAPFQATGYFRKPQALGLRQMLDEQGALGNCRVVMIHHPPMKKATPPHKRLIGAKRFRDVIEESGAELILHGHTHLDTIEWLDGPNGKVPVVCVPAAGQAPGGKRPAARYNLFEITRSNQGWSIRMKEYGFQSRQTNPDEPLVVIPISNRLLEPDMTDIPIIP